MWDIANVSEGLMACDHLPPEQKVAGSSPAGRTKSLKAEPFTESSNTADVCQ